MKTGDRGGSGGPTPRRLRSALVGGEVALSLVLLVVAGLLLRSVRELQAVSWGFEPRQVAFVRVAFAGPKYADLNERRIAWRRLVSELQAKPGFDSVATSFDRIGESWNQTRFRPDGFVPPTEADTPEANFHSVSPDYFRTLGITLLQGRTFTLNDTHETTPVALIDATIAHRYFPDGNAVGKRIQLFPDAPHSEIIGVVAAVKTDGPEASRRPDVYAPYLQASASFVYVFVRTSLDVATVGRTVQGVLRGIDAGMPTTDLGAMTQVIERPAAARRFPVVLLAAFSMLAVVLAGVGIYAVTSYGVTQRTRELGVRMALGAPPRAVIALVLRQGFVPIAIGMTIGIVLAGVTAFLMRNLLFGVAPFDAITFVVIPLLLGVIAALACLIPARRATKVDPMIALRAE